LLFRRRRSLERNGARQRFSTYIYALTEKLSYGIILASNEEAYRFGVRGVAADRQNEDPDGRPTVGVCPSLRNSGGKRALL